MSHLTYAEAIVVGLIQGVTELFPVSSLGHNVLIPALVGGQWAQDLSVSKPESPYLAFIVGLHVATAVAMIIYFWRDWVRIIGGFFSSLRERRVATADQRLAWMIILATIPVGIAGLALEHLFRVVFSKPVPTALFLAVNGLILLSAERQRRRSADARASAWGGSAPAWEGSAPAWEGSAPAAPAWEGGMAAQGARDHAVAGTRYPAQRGYPGGGGYHPLPGSHAAQPQGSRQRETEREQETERAVAADRRLSMMGYGRATLIGAAQILALLPGISRDGIVTVIGMTRGLNREDAVRYSFLLSAPVILAAGMLKIPDLFGPLGAGIHGQVLVASLVSGIGAYLSIRYLVRYFSKSRTLTPFAIYCLVAGLGSLAYFAIR
ncbi:MAG: undecaprenyl-diphosphate phosphatase [Streptosporangiaceae bacterium]|nr:undecaprenyl-diphosphate phosphatase [Streptosporangiaceae bacterium]MBV9854526.1 undecaprenyl-diphosphate phosphatase [Streptosporangiaceae bacterium]